MFCLFDNYALCFLGGRGGVMEATLRFSVSDWNVRHELKKPNFSHRWTLVCAGRSSFVRSSGGGSVGSSLTQ